MYIKQTVMHVCDFEHCSKNAILVKLSWIHDIHYAKFANKTLSKCTYRSARINLPTGTKFHS